MRSRTWSVVALVGVCIPGVVPVVNAQEQVAQASGVEEIIVTARKRQESILKVPVVETVLTPEQLEAKQIVDIQSLTTNVPGLNIGQAVLSIGPQISLRGVGTSSLDAGIDQSIALNIDGLSLSQGLAYNVAIFDLAQAEVLKGPQSLFFGKNSPGGVIALRSNDPGATREIIARSGYEFEAEKVFGEVILSGPLSDTFGMRLAVHAANQHGYFNNKATALPGLGGRTPTREDFSPSQNRVVRATALWTPTEQFTARAKLNYAYDRTDGDAGMSQTAHCPDGTDPVPGYNIPFIHPDDNCKLDRDVYLVWLDPAAFPTVRNGGEPFLELEQKFGTAEMVYETEKVAYTALTGFYRADSDSLINGTLTGYAATPLGADNKFHRQDFTQELRLDTDLGGALNFAAGAFYQDGEIYNRILLNGNTALGLPPVLRTGSHEISIESFSLFGQARWQVVPALEVALGTRWTHESRGDDAYNLAGEEPVKVEVPDISTDNWSPELTVTWTPTNTFTLFGSVKQGYKSGSYTITTPVSEGLDNSFDDERVRSGEMGIKTVLLGGDLRLNLAGYYSDYAGMQVGVNQQAENGFSVVRTLNAGSAEIYGVDFDMTYAPVALSGLVLDAAVNYNHARFESLKDAPCTGGQTIDAGCAYLFNPSTGAYTAQDLSGVPLIRAPEWQVNAGATYMASLGPEYTMSVGADIAYSTKYLTSLSRRSDVYQDAYTTIGAHVSVGPASERWKLSLIGRNLTDKITTGTCNLLNLANGQILGGYTTGTDGYGPAGVDEMACVARPGRELWVRGEVRI